MDMQTLLTMMAERDAWFFPDILETAFNRGYAGAKYKELLLLLGKAAKQGLVAENKDGTWKLTPTTTETNERKKPMGKKKGETVPVATVATAAPAAKFNKSQIVRDEIIADSKWDGKNVEAAAYLNEKYPGQEFDPKSIAQLRTNTKKKAAKTDGNGTAAAASVVKTAKAKAPVVAPLGNGSPVAMNSIVMLQRLIAKIGIEKTHQMVDLVAEAELD